MPTLAPAARGATRFATRVVTSRVRRNLAALLLVTVVAAGAGWMYVGVERSMRDLRAQGLPALLEAKTKSLEVYIDERRAEAARWARDARLRAATVALAHAAAQSPRAAAELCRDVPGRDWLAAVAPLQRDEGVVAANAVDRSGRIIASTQEAACGIFAQPRSAAPQLADVFAGRTQFVRPFASDAQLVAAQPYLDARPLAWVETPVHDDSGAVVAALGVARFVDTSFQSILAAARPGETGEAYAFDENGTLLSGVRSTRGLRSAGLLPAGDANGGTLRLRIRDPGSELAADGPMQQNVDAWPLTRPVAAALAAAAASGAPAQGLLLDPYRNYRGAEVIGAWRWLRNERIGIVAEMGVDEAYAPLRYVRAAFAGTVGLLVLAAGWAAWSTLALWRMSRDPGAGRRIGAYRLERKLAEGGMATVYLARHALLKRPTAVKIVKRHLATDELLARFEREVRLASSLEHPNTVEIYDFGHTADGLFYYAMEYLDGLTLDELVAQEGPPPLGRTRQIARQICSALAEVHGKGMVHRDVKPHNIMLTERGGEFDFVKLLDFGIVKRLRAGGDVAKPDDERALTQQVRLLGTPSYMAPERIGQPSAVDARADIYGVGAILFFLLTGKPPFDAPEQPALLRAVLSDPAPSVRAFGADVPAALDDLVARCLAKSAADRPADVAEIVAALDAMDLPRWTREDARSWWAGRRAAAGSAGPGVSTA
jgi:tRNA A-37 threonylcarbamoyl transferase component Bud32